MFECLKRPERLCAVFSVDCVNTVQCSVCNVYVVWYLVHSVYCARYSVCNHCVVFSGTLLLACANQLKRGKLSNKVISICSQISFYLYCRLCLIWPE